MEVEAHAAHNLYRIFATTVASTQKVYADSAECLDTFFFIGLCRGLDEWKTSDIRLNFQQEK